MGFGQSSSACLAVCAVVIVGCSGGCFAGSGPTVRPVKAANPTVVDVGGFLLTDRSGSGAVKLSGITYGGGSTFYAVGGGSAKVYQLEIDIDRQTGVIRSASIKRSAWQLHDEVGRALGGADLEGIVLAGGKLYVANEDGPQVSAHDLRTRNRLAHATTASAAQLNVFSHSVRNRSWESLGGSRDGSVLWTANEEALTIDGPLASRSAGTVVRLQRLDGDLIPSGQWAYRADAIDGKSGSRYDRSGVVDMLVLDDGRLIVLERSVGKGFRIQLNLVDCGGATDVSADAFNAGLKGQSFTPVSKTTLFMKKWTSRDQVNNYFVGMTLGPVLHDGGQSVILIADNGGTLNFLVPNNQHAFHALRIEP